MNDPEILFCTYFDKFYLIKGLTMYHSLIQHFSRARLWVLCMDSYTYDILRALKLKNVKIISLSEFEDSELKKAKVDRSSIEYYWTCTPSLPLYVFQKNKSCHQVVYLDSDLYFYSSPDPLFSEFNNNSIYVAEHRFPQNLIYREKLSGRFNVGVLIFRRDREGLSSLKRWRKQCIKWCYFREEDGKMGDQVYLNEWPTLYKKIKISENLGVDAAPWNINQYKITFKNKDIYINSDKLICYHFHQFKILSKSNFSLCSRYLFPFYEYKISKEVKKFIYKPYIESIKDQINILLRIDPKFAFFEKRKLISISNFKNIISL